MRAIVTYLFLLISTVIIQDVAAEVTKENPAPLPDQILFKDQLMYPKWDPTDVKLWEDLSGALDKNPCSKQKLQKIDKIYARVLDEKKWVLNVSPVYREIKDVASEASTIFSAFGYELSILWGNPSQEHHLDVGSYVAKQQDWLVVIENPENSAGLIAYQEFKTEAWFNSLFYDFQSDNQFEFIKFVLSAGPSALDSIQSRGEIYRIKIQIILASFVKPTFIKRYKDLDIYLDSVYYFKRPNFNGFQLGTPGKGIKIELVLYPEDNKEIHVQIYKGENGHITQDHIDYIIRSFKPNILGNNS